ncbi:MAG: hypothetical protein PHR35_14235 [Kiritimatiellae bacterium]|nr:hypothetical protein [Kiritimatiellia bacterium]
MRDVIQQVIAAEAEAKRIVSTAKEEEDGVMAAARQRAQSIAAQARLEARQEADLILAESDAGASARKRELLEQAEQSLLADIRLENAARQEAVAAVLRCVCGQPPP